MTLSTKIEVFTDFTLFAVGLHTCTAVARSLCVIWAFLFYLVVLSPWPIYTHSNQIPGYASVPDAELTASAHERKSAAEAVL